jgi:predicted nucleotidyltransferase
MSAIQKKQLPKKELQHLGVKALILFGSQTQGVARAGSDYDIGALLEDNKVLQSPKERSALYSALYDVLSEVIQKLVNIDIVFLDDAPAELQMHVVNYGVPLYETNRHVFTNFKERVMLLYADFAPYRELFHASILKRIPSQ